MIPVNVRPDIGMWPAAPAPAIVCVYPALPIADALHSVGQLLRGLSTGDVLRLVTTDQRVAMTEVSAVIAVSEWCASHQHPLLRQEIAMECGPQGCERYLYFDIAT